MRRRIFTVTPGRSFSWKHMLARARRTPEYKNEAWLLLTRNRRKRFVESDDVDEATLPWSNVYCSLELCSPESPKHDPQCKNYREGKPNDEDFQQDL